MKWFNKKDKIDIVDFYKEQERRERKEKFKKGFNDAVLWCELHYGVFIVAVPAVCSLGTMAAKSYSKHVNMKMQQTQDLRVYDARNGHHCEIRRKLTPSEQVELDFRRRNGESITAILDSMKLLK